MFLSRLLRLPLPHLLLPLLVSFSPSLSFSLRNCTIAFSSYDSDVSVSCTDRKLTAVPGDVPKDANSLDLSSNEVERINRTDFLGFGRLVSLQLILNGLSVIEDGAFTDLTRLQDLDLRYNVLTDLTDQLFLGLTNLRRLALSRNRIRWISQRAFDPLVSIQEVELSINDLHRLSDLVPVLQRPTLQSLEAGVNRFTSFDSADLPLNTSNLRRLVFNLNPLQRFSLTRDLFPHLQHLDLTKCSSGFRWDVPDQSFLRSLTSLYVGSTEISFETYRSILQSTPAVDSLWLTYVKDWLDKGLVDVACQIPALTRLDLTFNDIFVLQDSLLQSCSAITELALASNQLTDLAGNSLRPLTQLKELRLSANFLSRVPAAVNGLSSLRVLELDNNDIGEIGCSDFRNLTSLTQLILAKNRISRVPTCAFEDLTDLRLLYIQDNPIISFHGSFGVHLHNLRILNMNGNNPMELRPGDFSSLSNLLHLDLKSLTNCQVENGTFDDLHRLQRLTLFPYSLKNHLFSGLTSLQTLDLYLPTLRLSRIPQVRDESPFLHLSSLKELRITDINEWAMKVSPDLLRGLHGLEVFVAQRFFKGTPHPDTFRFTPRLTSLQIMESNITDPRPDLLQPVPHLKELDLSKNKLRSLDFLSRANLSELTWMSLRDNELTVINESVFQYLPALTYLDLFGNPFTCDCSNSGFIQWVKSNPQTQVVHAFQFLCSFPPSKQGTKLLDFDLQSCWISISFLCFVLSSVLVLLTVLAAFIHHFLRLQLTYAYHLFLAYLYDSRQRRNRTPDRYDAFVSYNVHDEDWVCGEMLPVLEGQQGWRLCLHHRDFQPGKAIIENITDAIYGSRKTICVISRRFLQSEWCSRELQMASFRLFDEQKDVLVLLLLEDLPLHHLSPFLRMKKLLKRRSYLSWPQGGAQPHLFWDNVRRALEAPTHTPTH